MSVYPACFFSSTHYTSGVSASAQVVAQYEKKILSHISQSISLGWRENLRQKLMDVLQKCASADWDGYHANPITFSSFCVASQFLYLLPNNIEIPTIVPENTGEIGFEWSKGKFFTFVISTHSSTTLKKITYTGILGTSKICGEMTVTNKLPCVIKTILFEYFNYE